MDNDKYVECFYDSDEGIAWGPPTLREIKSILKKPSCKPHRRHTIDIALNQRDKIDNPYDSDGNRDSITDVCDHLTESENNKSKDSNDSSGIIYEIDDNSESVSSSSEIWKCMHDPEFQSYYNSVVSQEKDTNVSCEICEQENNSFGCASIQELNINDSTKSDEGNKSISAQVFKNNLSVSDMVPPTNNDANESCNKSFQENISFESVQEFNICDTSKKSLKNIDTVHCDNISSTFGSKNKTNENCQSTEHENTNFVLASVQELNINDSSLKSLENIDNSSEQILAQEFSIKSNTFSNNNKYTDESLDSTRLNFVRQALNKTENPIEDFYQTLVKSSFLDKGDRSNVDNTDFEISELSYNSGNPSPVISIPEIDVHQFSEDSDCLLDNTFDRITNILNQTEDTSLLNVRDNQENNNKEPDGSESSRRGSFEDEQCNEKRVIQHHIGTETPNHKVKSCIPVIKNSGPPVVKISSLPVKNTNTDFRVPHTPIRTKGNKYKPNIKDIVSPVRMYINYSPISVQKHNVTSKDCNLPLVSNKCVTRNNENKSPLPKVVYKPSKTKIIEQGKNLQLPGSIEKHVKNATTTKHARVLTSGISQFKDKTLIDVADLTNNSSVYTDPAADISVLQTKTALK